MVKCLKYDFRRFFVFYKENNEGFYQKEEFSLQMFFVQLIDIVGDVFDLCYEFLLIQNFSYV